MKVRIKRIDKTLPLPVYETQGAVGFDLYAREERLIKAHTLDRIPSNVIIETPKGYGLIISLRSSTPKKWGLLIPHGVGVIDQDYCGENDEILIQVINFTDQDIVIDRGTKIAQGLFVRIDQMEFEEHAKMTDESRGGFGSTSV